MRVKCECFSLSSRHPAFPNTSMRNARIGMCILQIFTAPYPALLHTSSCVLWPIKALSSCSNPIKVSFRLKYNPLPRLLYCSTHSWKTVHNSSPVNRISDFSHLVITDLFNLAYIFTWSSSINSFPVLSKNYGRGSGPPAKYYLSNILSEFWL